MIGKAGNWGGRGGAGGQETLPVGSGGAENVLPTVFWSSVGNGESWILRGVSAGICASSKRKQELIRACSRLSDSGEWHFPLSERLKQAKSWWANKMVEQKEALLLVMKTTLYKHRTSVYCWLFCSKPQPPCLLKMRKTALLQRQRWNLQVNKHLKDPHFLPACINFTYENKQVFSKCTIKSTSRTVKNVWRKLQVVSKTRGISKTDCSPLQYCSDSNFHN